MEEDISILLQESYPCTIFYSAQDTEGILKEDISKQWTDNPQGVSPQYPYEFVCTRFYKNIDKEHPEQKEWTPWSIDNISLWAHYGKNASPVSVTLGNPYESIYAIEASGATRKAYVIIDGDGATTGEIVLKGGTEDSKGSCELTIDQLAILDSTGNIEYSFTNSNYLTVDLGDNWKCRFELTEINGRPIINLVGIGANPENPVTPPQTIELSDTDACYECDLNGKYQKKIIIRAKNLKTNIQGETTWTISAIHDKNGDGIYRYQIMPSIDRVVKTSYFKKLEEGNREHISSTYNIGTAQSVIFDIEKDTYGKAWTDIINQKCRLVFKNSSGGEAFVEEATSGPIIINFQKLQDIVDRMSNTSPYTPQLEQYIVELQVVDADYDPEYETYKTNYESSNRFSTVDKCNLVFEYIVSEAGKDGKDGKDGSDTMFNLTNDSGSYGYNYVTQEVILSNNDKSTKIQYSQNSNFIVCDSITIGETEYTDSTTGTYYNDDVAANFTLTKESQYWELVINSLSMPSYVSVFAIPIVGKLNGKQVGAATFKLTGVQDLNGDGVYAYRLIPEHAYTGINAGADTMEVTVYRDVLIEGAGYNNTVAIAVQALSKKNNSVLSTKTSTVSCESPTNIDTGVTLSTIQSNQGAVFEVYVDDEDYNKRKSIPVEGKTYYYTGESEDVSWTAPGGADGDTSVIERTVTNIYNLIGQAYRLRPWESGLHYFPIINSISDLKNSTLQSTLQSIYNSQSDDKEVAYEEVEGENVYIPMFYDVVYKGINSDTNTAQLWQAKKYSSTTAPVENSDYWIKANQYDFIAANSAYIENLAAKNVQAEKILVKSGNKVVAGLINGDSAFNDIKKTNTTLTSQGDDTDPVIFFAGLPSNATSLKNSEFYVTKSGKTSIGDGSSGGSGGSGGTSTGSTDVNFANVKAALESDNAQTPLKLSVNGNILAEQFTLSKTAATQNDPTDTADRAWFKFELVNGHVAPVLYWNVNGITKHLDFANKKYVKIVEH